MMEQPPAEFLLPVVAISFTSFFVRTRCFSRARARTYTIKSCFFAFTAFTARPKGGTKMSLGEGEKIFCLHPKPSEILGVTEKVKD